ncbi:MAG: hypothetical protein WBE92_11410 [Steroidobacteraceae bacterium]
MKRIFGGPPARLAVGLAALSLTSLPPAPALGQQPPALPNGASRIDGTIAVTINATRLKHWGVPGADAAFVPDADRSTYAARIRAAASARALCSALSDATGRDRSIASAPVDGDANLDHRSGDEELMTFVVTIAEAKPTRGALYICSQPVFAMMSQGGYPRESFYQVGAARSLWWTGYRLSLRPGESTPVHLTASVDASGW